MSALKTDVRLGVARLNAAKIKSIWKFLGMHGDGNGLYLLVTGSGSRSWMQRIVIHGRRRDLGIDVEFGGIASRFELDRGTMTQDPPFTRLVTPQGRSMELETTLHSLTPWLIGTEIATHARPESSDTISNENCERGSGFQAALSR